MNHGRLSDTQLGKHCEKRKQELVQALLSSCWASGRFGTSNRERGESDPRE